MHQLIQATASSVMSLRHKEGGQGGRHASGGDTIWDDACHSQVRSERDKNRSERRAERKLLPEIWDIRHLAPGSGTIHSWAICVSALQEKQAQG